MFERRCPVCGMDSRDSDLCEVHFGIAYMLCSKQCQENFLAYPGLYVGVHAVDRDLPGLMRHRRIHLQHPLDIPAIVTLKRKLQALMGVEYTHLSDRVLVVRYQLLKIRLCQIENFLADQGIELCMDVWCRWKRAWVNYTEDNALKAQLERGGACCNRPPGKY